MKPLPTLLAVATAGAVLTAVAQQLRHDGGVAYVEGAGREAAGIAPDANLDLRFVDTRSGRPLADIALVVTDVRGETVLGLHSADERVRARLEPGRYRVAATLHGIEQVREVDVPATGARAEVFGWRDPLPGLR